MSSTSHEVSVENESDPIKRCVKHRIFSLHKNSFTAPAPEQTYEPVKKNTPPAKRTQPSAPNSSKKARLASDLFGSGAAEPGRGDDSPSTNTILEFQEKVCVQSILYDFRSELQLKKFRTRNQKKHLKNLFWETCWIFLHKNYPNQSQKPMQLEISLTLQTLLFLYLLSRYRSQKLLLRRRLHQKQQLLLTTYCLVTLQVKRQHLR